MGSSNNGRMFLKPSINVWNMGGMFEGGLAVFISRSGYGKCEWHVQWRRNDARLQLIEYVSGGHRNLKSGCVDLSSLMLFLYLWFGSYLLFVDERNHVSRF